MAYFTKADKEELKEYCNKYNFYNISDGWKTVAKTKKDDSLQINRLLMKKGCKAALEEIKAEEESQYINKPFAMMVWEYCKGPKYKNKLDEKNFMSPEYSYELFMDWCEEQNISAKNFVTEIEDVIDRKTFKRNTICLIGDSNAGKTQVVSLPLKHICRFTGQLGNRGSNGDFVFQECINKRLITIDECIINPQNIEDWKILLGGEKLLSQVKFQGHCSIDRTPRLS